MVKSMFNSDTPIILSSEIGDMIDFENNELQNIKELKMIKDCSQNNTNSHNSEKEMSKNAMHMLKCKKITSRRKVRDRLSSGAITENQSFLEDTKTKG